MIHAVPPSAPERGAGFEKKRKEPPSCGHATEEDSLLPPHRVRCMQRWIFSVLNTRTKDSRARRCPHKKVLSGLTVYIVGATSKERARRWPTQELQPSRYWERTLLRVCERARAETLITIRKSVSIVRVLHLGESHPVPLPLVSAADLRWRKFDSGRRRAVWLYGLDVLHFVFRREVGLSTDVCLRLDFRPLGGGRRGIVLLFCAGGSCLLFIWVRLVHSNVKQIPRMFWELQTSLRTNPPL